jgi:hypothetical protein
MKRLWVIPLLMSAWSATAIDLPAECQRPQRPSIPEGDSVTKPELLAARTTLEQYLKDGDRYLVCLRKFDQGLGERASEVDGHELLAKFNGMVDEMYLAGDEFNVALRRFKKRQAE